MTARRSAGEEAACRCRRRVPPSFGDAVEVVLDAIERAEDIGRWIDVDL